MLRIDPGSALPVYAQLQQQIIEEIDTGELPVGARLPTVRKLADDLGIAPNTVARVYRELEAAGVIITRGRHGSFVADAGDAGLEQQLADDFVRRVRERGADPAAALRHAARLLGITAPG